MARRRKQYSLSTVQILGLAFISIIFLLFYKSNLNLDGFIPAFLGITIILFAFTSLFLIWKNNQKKAALRAITLSGIDTMTGIEFEKYVGELLRNQNYKISFTATSHDYGVDITASKDGIKTAVQLKRYSYTVGRAAISDAVAGMAHYKCNQTMVVTSNYFTKEAKELASSNNCVLVDRDKLSEWIYNFQNI